MQKEHKRKYLLIFCIFLTLVNYKLYNQTSNDSHLYVKEGKASSTGIQHNVLFSTYLSKSHSLKGGVLGKELELYKITKYSKNSTSIIASQMQTAGNNTSSDKNTGLKRVNKTKNTTKKTDFVKVQQLETCRTNLPCKGKKDGINFTVSTELESYSNIWKRHKDVIVGGSWKPNHCISKSRFALIVPYRNRTTHLQLFIKNIIPFLKAQNKAFTIFVVEQIGDELFNKAQLMNAGFIESQKLGKYTCFIFHDVDMAPINLCNIYECPSKGMRHLGLSRDVEHPHMVYGACIGGASAFTKDVFTQINGFTNVMFGWGGEDDDGFFRLQRLHIKIHRHNVVIGNYMPFPHIHNSHINPKSRRGRKAVKHNKYLKYDGLNATLNYQVGKIIKEQLFTRLLINIPGPRTLFGMRNYFDFMTKEFEAQYQQDNPKPVNATTQTESAAKESNQVAPQERIQGSVN